MSNVWDGGYNDGSVAEYPRRFVFGEEEAFFALAIIPTLLFLVLPPCI